VEAVVDLAGLAGRGAPRPAVSDPSPSFCSESASSFPVGFNPFTCWKCFIASMVPASHLPVGVVL